MKNVIAITFAALSLTCAAAHAASPAGSCADAGVRMQDDSRTGWLAMRQAHPKSGLAVASLCMQSGAVASSPSSGDGTQRTARQVDESRVGWLAMQTAHPLSGAAAAMFGR